MALHGAGSIVSLILLFHTKPINQNLPLLCRAKGSHAHYFAGGGSTLSYGSSSHVCILGYCHQ